MDLFVSGLGLEGLPFGSHLVLGCLFVCLFVCLSVCLSVCLFVCLFVVVWGEIAFVFRRVFPPKS